MAIEEKPSEAVNVLEAAFNRLQQRIRAPQMGHEKEVLSDLSLLFREANVMDPSGRVAKILADDVIPKISKSPERWASSAPPNIYGSVSPGSFARPSSDIDTASSLAAAKIQKAIASGEIKGWETMTSDQKTLIAHKYFFSEIGSATDQHLQNLKRDEAFMEDHKGDTQANINAARGKDENGNPTSGWGQTFRHPIDSTLPGIAGFLPDLAQVIVASRGGRGAAGLIKGSGTVAKVARPVIESASGMLPFAKHEVDAGYAAPIEQALEILRNQDPPIPPTYDNLVRLYEIADAAHKANPTEFKSIDQLHSDAVKKGYQRGAAMIAVAGPMAGASLAAKKAGDYILPRVLPGYTPKFVYDPKSGFQFTPGNKGGQQAFREMTKGEVISTDPIMTRAASAAKDAWRNFKEPPIMPGSFATAPIPGVTRALGGVADGAFQIGGNMLGMSTMEPTAKLFSDEGHLITPDDFEQGALMGLQFAPMHLGAFRGFGYRPDQIWMPAMPRGELAKMFVYDQLNRTPTAPKAPTLTPPPPPTIGGP